MTTGQKLSILSGGIVGVGFLQILWAAFGFVPIAVGMFGFFLAAVGIVALLSFTK